MIRLDDRQIIDLFLERSEQAVPRLAEQYGALIRRVVGNILPDPRDAEECVQDIYPAVWNRVPPTQPDNLPAYVCAAARNLALARVRADSTQKRRSNFALSLDELENTLCSSADPAHECEAAELAAAFERWLTGLRQEDRFLFLRRHYYGDGVSEIATGLHCSAHRVSVRLHRLRNSLRTYLTKEGLLP